MSPRQKALVYADCCGRYVEDIDATPAPAAERLLRSRYSAFVLHRRDYLLAPWHASQRPATLEFEPGAPWLGLLAYQEAAPCRRAPRTALAAHSYLQAIQRGSARAEPCAAQAPQIYCGVLIAPLP